MHPLELKIRRVLSRHPHLKSYASAARRRLIWRGRSAAGHWDEHVDEVESSAPRGWLDSEVVEREHIRLLISGDSEVSYLESFVSEHLAHRSAKRILSLGCGGGNLERALLALGASEQIEGLDASPASIDLAKKLAVDQGLAEYLSYRVVDADSLNLDPAAYDAVVAKMSLHHFERLEEVFDQVQQSLRPGGVFMFNEFVGPSRFQWTEQQLDHMNRLLGALPPTIRDRTALAEIRRPLVADVIAQDPSESIRSAEIMPLVRERFDIVEEKPYGGTLLHILLEQIMPLLALSKAEDLAYLRLIMAYERALIETGVLPSDFVYVVARARS